jgi:hypothetical protein
MSGVTVVLRGGGVNLTGTTNDQGIVRFTVRPRSVGVIRISVAQPLSCSALSRRVRAVGVFKPPKPNFTGR